MAEIEMYGVIDGDWVKDLKAQIKHVPAHEPIELRVSSPGGSLSAGVSAYNLLSQAPNEVIATMDGDAFSAATIPLCACEHVEAPSNVLLMVHDPWLPIIAPATLTEVESQYRYLKATRQQALDIYAQRTGATKRKLGEMMRAETYFTAREALDLGLITNVIGPSDQVQSLAIDKYLVRDRQKLAQALGQRPRSLADVEGLLTRLGVSKDAK